MDEHPADELFRRALIDADASAAVALRVLGLPLCEALTIVFHGRRDLGTIQTYVAHGGRGAGAAVGADELMRVPCDLDLAAAEDRDEAEHLYAEQAAAMRDALEAADTVLDIWREPLEDLAHAHVGVDRRIGLELRLPAHRLLPAALVARVYPLPDDPERCLEDFFEHAAEHARRVGEQLGRQEQSVRRFLELSGEGFEETA